MKVLVKRVLRSQSARGTRPVAGRGSDLRGPNICELRKPQTLLSPAQVDNLLQEYRAGVSVRELAQRYEVHRATVTAHAHRHGLPPRRRSLDHDEQTEAAQLYQDGLTMRQVAERFAVSPPAVRTALVRQAVPIRARGQRLQR